MSINPELFSMYMRPLGDIIRKHNLSLDFYADDTQLHVYMTVKPNDQIRYN